jgi:D-glycero-D-manno-heptose 1,7-bisphosphate phosphatase
LSTPRVKSLQAVLLDRDGTINVQAPPHEYISTPEDLHLLDGAAEAIARLNQAGIPVVIVTNQRGVARGMMSMDDVDRVHDALAQRLAQAGAHVDGVLVCPHGDGECSCRKPQPGMLLTALDRLHVEPADAVMIGDADSDIEAGRRAGTYTVQIVPDSTPSRADLSAPSLAAAVELLLGRPGAA